MTPEMNLALIGAIGSALGALMLLLGTRGKTRADAKIALDQRIDDRVTAQLAGAWKEIDDLKATVRELTEQERKKSSAFARILRTIARQWPHDGGPDLDPADIALIEDSIPVAWIRRAPTK